MLEIYGLSSLAKAATNRTYQDARSIYEDASMISMMEEQESKQFMLTPCRFSKSGWKYIPINSDLKYLKHPNKVNSIGYSNLINNLNNSNNNNSIVSNYQISNED